MSTAATFSEPFVDRRDYTSLGPAPIRERRQWA